MQEPNLKIISDMKDFLFSVSTNKCFRTLFATSPKAFTRNRKLPFDRLSLFLIQLCKKTLSVELEDFFQSIKANISYSVAAFTQQRLKLDPSFFYCWNRVLCDSFYSHYSGQVKRWKGYRIVGVDGSNIALVKKPDLQQVFGGQSNQTGSFVQAKTFYAYDVLNKLVLFPTICPYRYGEMRAACDMLRYAPLDPDFLMILDRNFSNYRIIALLEMREQPLKYVIRAKDGLNLTKQFMNSGKREEIVYITPTATIIEGLHECGFIVSPQTKLKVRLIRVLLNNGNVEVLMTNLWKEEGYPAHLFKDLYAKRWGIETNIGLQKNILQLEALSGQTPITILQDFYATVLTTNIHSFLIKPAQKTFDEADTKTKYPRQVNNNKAFGRIKRYIVAIFTLKSPQEILCQLHSYFIRAPLPVRTGRSFPRIRQNPMTKSKHRMFTNYKPAY
jgi:hypothetical protein